MRFLDVYEDYLLSKELAGVSPNTLERYKYSIHRIGIDLKNPDIADVTTGNIRGWLMARTYSEVSRSIDIKNLRTFFRWTVSEGYREDDPMAVIPTPKLPDLAPKAMSDGDVKKLIQVSRKSNRRDLAIVLTLLDSAIRASELGALQRSDIDPLTGVIRVTNGKGGKSRLAFVSPTTCRAVNRYLATRHDDDPALFLSQRGEPMDRNSLRLLMYRLCNRAGIQRRGPHALRHTAATMMARSGIDAWSLQHLLGHSDNRTSLRYIWLTSTDVKQAHDRYSPVAGVLR